MKQGVMAGAALGLVIITAIFGFQYLTAGPAESAATTYTVPAFGETYTNKSHNFSLRLPQGFTAREIPIEDSRSQVIVLDDTAGNGIQIMITPFEEDLAEFTEKRIRATAPTILMSEPRAIKMGKQYRGFAFKSNSEAFDGASSEVWFVFNKKLYQISTYDRLDLLLMKIFGTWRFF